MKSIIAAVLAGISLWGNAAAAFVVTDSISCVPSAAGGPTYEFLSVCDRQGGGVVPPPHTPAPVCWREFRVFDAAGSETMRLAGERGLSRYTVIDGDRDIVFARFENGANGDYVYFQRRAFKSATGGGFETIVIDYNRQGSAYNTGRLNDLQGYACTKSRGTTPP